MKSLAAVSSLSFYPLNNKYMELFLINNKFNDFF